MQPNSSGKPGKRKKREEHEEHVAHAVHDESNWLVSYADMMTLLFGFFVLMYSMSRIDQEKFKVVQKDMVKYFGGKMTDPAFPGTATEKTIEDVTKELSQALGQAMSAEQFNIKADGDSLVVALDSDMLFGSGSAKPGDKAVLAINKVYETVKKHSVDLIEVEGHTDGDPISTPTFPSNWELSAARASSIVRIFSQLKVPAEQLRIAGYGSSRPLVKEKDDQGKPLLENKSKNRRVVLNLKLNPKDKGIKKTLEEQGLNLKEEPVTAKTPDVASVNSDGDEMSAMQLKYKEMADRFQQVERKLAEAKDKQKKMKELETLSKKTQTLEAKIQQMEKKAEEAGKPAETAPEKGTKEVH